MLIVLVEQIVGIYETWKQVTFPNFAMLRALPSDVELHKRATFPISAKSAQQVKSKFF